MKAITQSMDPRDAAKAFYGQNEDSFTEMVARLTASDPRLQAAFENTRRRFHENSATQTTRE
jgi:hypothetical protein